MANISSHRSKSKDFNLQNDLIQQLNPKSSLTSGASVKDILDSHTSDLQTKKRAYYLNRIRQNISGLALFVDKSPSSIRSEGSEHSPNQDMKNYELGSPMLKKLELNFEAEDHSSNRNLPKRRGSISLVGSITLSSPTMNGCKSISATPRVFSVQSPVSSKNDTITGCLFSYRRQKSKYSDQLTATSCARTRDSLDDFINESPLDQGIKKMDLLPSRTSSDRSSKFFSSCSSNTTQSTSQDLSVKTRFTDYVAQLENQVSKQA